jgi:hypothetical protein
MQAYSSLFSVLSSFSEYSSFLFSLCFHLVTSSMDVYAAIVIPVSVAASIAFSVDL